MNRDSSSSPKSGSLDRVLLSPKEAKTLLRVKRFSPELVEGVMEIFTGERYNEQNERSREESSEESWEEDRRRRRYDACAAHAQCNIPVCAHVHAPVVVHTHETNPYDLLCNL